MTTTAHELATALFELLKAETEIKTVPDSHWAQEAMARYEEADSLLASSNLQGANKINKTTKYLVDGRSRVHYALTRRPVLA